MRVETTRVAAPVRMQHATGRYDGTDNLVAQVLPIVAPVLARGETVALAVCPPTREALQEHFAGAPGLVRMNATAAGPRGSGQTTAARWARELRDLTTRSGPVTVISEHDSTHDGVQGRYWTELDAAVNVALRGLPVALYCFYPEFPLHEEILEGALRNHPLLLAGGVLRHNPDHRDPREVLAAMPVAPPILLGAPDVELTFTAWQLHEVRTAVVDLAGGSTFGRSRIEDLVLAINEIATNAVEHGSGEAQMALWLSADGLAAEVHDGGGALTEPLPGLRAPHPSDPRGRGVWIARQLCDVLHVWRDRAGTHVRMHAAP